jgi:hypothetical protein
MRNILFFMVLFLLVSRNLFAQISINDDISAPDPSAMLDVKSTTKGALLPRMTQAQILAIQNPADGLIVFCTTDNKLYVYYSADSKWQEVLYGPGVLGQPFPCGISFTVDHFAGTVAPVTKTVTYGTVNGIPGEPTKCWTTSNLGADHHATAVNDATEASSGWYWQFNRKQGYKHDGTTRTPNTWIYFINENSDWLTSNDPCNLELGSKWRLPTYSEWYNIDNTGGWTNWNGPWGSGLKLHAAGYLNANNGLLFQRGSNGYYWSRTQESSYGMALHFYIDDSYLGLSEKLYGWSVRCLRD